MSKVKFLFAALAFMLTAGATWALSSNVVSEPCSEQPGTPADMNTSQCSGESVICCYEPNGQEPLAFKAVQ